MLKMRHEPDGLFRFCFSRRHAHEDDPMRIGKVSKPNSRVRLIYARQESSDLHGPNVDLTLSIKVASLIIPSARSTCRMGNLYRTVEDSVNGWSSSRIRHLCGVAVEGAN